jgi:hypothetical protein
MIDHGDPQVKGGGGLAHLPPWEQLGLFVRTLFDPGDLVSVRLITSWLGPDGRKGTRVVRQRQYEARDLAGPGGAYHPLSLMAERYASCCYFGVAPRPGGGGPHEYEMAYHVRLVRCLWADLDHCTTGEALCRVEAAGLPSPSVLVSSGHGAHVYWLLAEPVRVTDAGPPLPLRRRRLYDEAGRYLRTKKYVLGPAGEELPEPGLSPQARHVRDVLAGVAAAVGGDGHAHDLARLLRLPGTLNRKCEVNGRDPVPCELVACDAGRRYPFALLERFAETGARAVMKARRAEDETAAAARTRVAVPPGADAPLPHLLIPADPARVFWDVRRLGALCPLCGADHGCRCTADGAYFCLHARGDVGGWRCHGEARGGTWGIYRHPDYPRGAAPKGGAA